MAESSMRKICYVSGTRADFGLMQATLSAIHAHPTLELAIVVTGMHLSAHYGNTVDDIVRAGLPVTQRVPVDMNPPTGATMARNVGRMLTAFADAFEQIRPDVVLLLGDRGEMLAGALAAIHLNIPVAHIHGGERSGTVDEPVRHAISKLSHFHFAATADAAARLVRMGEREDHVWVTGAPGLDGVRELAHIDKAALCRDAGLQAETSIALMVFHPVLQEAATAGRDTAIVLDALADIGVQVMALMPNADAGSDGVRAVLEARAGRSGVALATHLPRDAFISWMAHADVMVGNSSAGIIEAASFGTPVVNIGTRQAMRERNANVVDVPVERNALLEAVRHAVACGRLPHANLYGDGHAARRIVDLLDQLPTDRHILMKANAY
ncbi:MAG: UDP-N-acetylglucosamine 2-epimerase [Telluria sp.]